MMKIYRPFRWAILVNLLLFVTFSLLAQPFEYEKGNSSKKIALYKDGANENVLGGFETGRTSKKGTKFYIKGVSGIDPVDIFLMSKPGQEVSLEVYYAHWSDKQNTCTASNGEYCQLKVRSYKDIGLMVKSEEEGAEFALAVVVKKAETPVLPSPFYAVNKAEMAKLDEATPLTNGVPAASNSGSSWMMYVIAGLLLAIVLLLFLMLKRKQAAVWLIFMFLSGGSLQAQLGSGGIVPGRDLGQFFTNRINNWYTTTSGQTRVRRGSDGIAEIVPSRTPRGGILYDPTALLNEIQKIIESGESLRETIEHYQGVDNCVTSRPYADQPRIPSYCSDTDPRRNVSSAMTSDNIAITSCSDCFRQARTNFNRIRWNFVRLKEIYTCTKSMSDDAIAFGDSFSAATKTGIGWVPARAGIVKSVKSLEQSYDAKYAELLVSLDQSLHELARCEEAYGDMPDWYDRFGFMYFEFMKLKYARG